MNRPRFAPNSPASAGEQPARGARRRLRILLETYAILALFVASYLLGSYALGAANPPNITPLVGGNQVTFNPGVTFVYTNQYVNMTFASDFVVTNNATWNPAVGPGWCFDGICLNVSKAPAAYPSATVNVSFWQPTVTSGKLLVFTLGTPAPSNILFTFTHFTPGANLIVMKDGAQYTTAPTSASSGAAAWTYFANPGTGGLFEVLIAGGGGGGPGPTIPFLPRPSFIWRTTFDLFNSSADQRVYFQDQTPIPANSSAVPKFLWTFGDGNSSAEQNPVHEYSFGASASFNVTEFVCLGTSCNGTTQTVTLTRAHLLLLGGVLLLTAIGSLIAVYRWRNK